MCNGLAQLEEIAKKTREASYEEVQKEGRIPEHV